MTEKERREKGLPPSPATEALMDTIRKDAEEKMQYVTEMTRPIFAGIAGPTASIAESIGRMSGPINEAGSAIAKMTEAHNSTLSEFARMYEPKEYSIPAIAFRPDRTVRLAPDQFNELVKRLQTQETPQHGKTTDLMYDWQEKEFYRFVFEQKVSSPFIDTEDNKRRLLIEKLLRAGGYVKTEKLAALLHCSTKQLGNIVAAINSRVEADLTLKDGPIIDSKRISGYRINPVYLVYQKK